jgi:hypothetical protein
LKKLLSLALLLPVFQFFMPSPLSSGIINVAFSIQAHTAQSVASSASAQEFPLDWLLLGIFIFLVVVNLGLALFVLLLVRRKRDSQGKP